VIALDTHAWLWWLHDPSRLGSAARARLEEESESGQVLVCAISVWEIATKVALGRLTLPLDLDAWLREASRYPNLEIEEIGVADLVESTRLPGEFHKDPADRIIVAFARRRRIPLVTTDDKILGYPHVETLW